MAYHGAQVHLTSLVDRCRVGCEESDSQEEGDVLESLDENCSGHPTFLTKSRSSDTDTSFKIRCDETIASLCSLSSISVSLHLARNFLS
jgi:hypothetical protein